MALALPKLSEVGWTRTIAASNVLPRSPGFDLPHHLILNVDISGQRCAIFFRCVLNAASQFVRKLGVGVSFATQRSAMHDHIGRVFLGCSPAQMSTIKAGFVAAGVTGEKTGLWRRAMLQFADIAVRPFGRPVDANIAVLARHGAGRNNALVRVQKHDLLNEGENVSLLPVEPVSAAVMAQSLVVHHAEAKADYSQRLVAPGQCASGLFHGSDTTAGANP